ncbi:esterase/lipase/thioesterase [Salix suchowensis]|nr:esterase/lipase/thioesterase [Salix suchowensis]
MAENHRPNPAFGKDRLCHGLSSTKEDDVMVNLAKALEKEGISVFRLDFAGNGESEGSFSFGNYRREADDLRAVIEHFRRATPSRGVSAILGHSKGGDVRYYAAWNLYPSARDAKQSNPATTLSCQFSLLIYISTYATASVAEVMLLARESPYCTLAGSLRLSAGALAVISLLAILDPILGFITYLRRMGLFAYGKSQFN